jgi:hypothetical protein
MGRPALHVQVSLDGTDIDIITAHFKSKLLTFPNGRFAPTDEGERARFAAYALYRRTAGPNPVTLCSQGDTRVSNRTSVPRSDPWIPIDCDVNWLCDQGLGIARQRLTAAVAKARPDVRRIVASMNTEVPDVAVRGADGEPPR